jgi:hypothetical protein
VLLDAPLGLVRLEDTRLDEQVQHPTPCPRPGGFLGPRRGLGVGPCARSRPLRPFSTVGGRRAGHISAPHRRARPPPAARGGPHLSAPPAPTLPPKRHRPPFHPRGRWLSAYRPRQLGAGSRCRSG